METVIIYDGEDKCPRCLGWKRIANDEDGGSWKYWAELPAQSALAVQMGLVKPIICPACNGSGRKTNAVPVV